MLDGVERNAELDDVTEEDIKEGRLNDDQLQALWGTTLAEAQSHGYRSIVAACTGAQADATPGDIAIVLYEAVISAGGKEIDEPDGGLPCTSN